MEFKIDVVAWFLIWPPAIVTVIFSIFWLALMWLRAFIIKVSGSKEI
jgi:hypothetical protein